MGVCLPDAPPTVPPHRTGTVGAPPARRPSAQPVAFLFPASGGLPPICLPAEAQNRGTAADPSSRKSAKSGEQHAESGRRRPPGEAGMGAACGTNFAQWDGAFCSIYLQAKVLRRFSRFLARFPAGISCRIYRKTLENLRAILKKVWYDMQWCICESICCHRRANSTET